MIQSAAARERIKKALGSVLVASSGSTPFRQARAEVLRSRVAAKMQGPPALVGELGLCDVWMSV